MTDAVELQFAMPARDVIRTMVRNRYRESFCLPNFTPGKWWECDVFEITKAGYFREYEVKVSRGDFFADAKKDKERWPHGWAPGAQKLVERKHDLLAAGDVRGPSAFYYVTPKGMVEPHELPVWAGLIHVELIPAYRESGVLQPARIVEREITKAPRLHRQKLAESVRLDALRTCYWRLLNIIAA